MKGIEIFCASQASTAICHSMYEASSSPSSNTVQLGGRAIDRHNPIIRDPRRTPSTDLTIPQSPSPSLSSSSPSSPYHQPQKAKKRSGSKPSKKGHDQKKKNGGGRLSEHITNSYCSKPIKSVLRSWVKPPCDLIPPPGSSRYLLTDTTIWDEASDYDPALASTPFDDDHNKKEAQHVHHQDQTNHASKPSSSSHSKPASSNQVVVLRVSLHCRGCEGKLKKHLSKMEGVTSFKIEFAAKKVTIVGDVTPLSVLASVSKVKNAQFWPLSAAPVSSAVPQTQK